MKNIRWMRKLSLGLITIAVLLAGCQQESLEVERSYYQQQATDVLTKYAGKISGAYQTAQKQSKNSVRGIGTGGSNSQGQFGVNSYWNGWDPFGGNPYGGSVQQNSMESEVSICNEMIKNVPKTVDNFYFMIASLARCLDVIVSYRNPMMTFAYRNLDDQSQMYWLYLLNYRRPGTLNTFPTNDQNYWSGFANNGWSFLGNGQ